MLDRVVVTQTGATPEIAARAMQRLMKAALGKLAAHHHHLYMAKHFTVAGGREYGYKPRQGEGKSGKEFWRSYCGQKKRKKGHQRPLVFSGESETLARIMDIRADSKRARIVQHARGLNRRSAHSAIRMNEEIRAISDKEARADTELFAEIFQDELSKLGDRIVRRT